MLMSALAASGLSGHACKCATSAGVSGFTWPCAMFNPFLRRSDSMPYRVDVPHLVQSLRWQMAKRCSRGSATRSPTTNSRTEATECSPW